MSKNEYADYAELFEVLEDRIQRTRALAFIVSEASELNVLMMAKFRESQDTGQLET